jgi:raffinose/stachyose/melibiose transport system permease protein
MEAAMRREKKPKAGERIRTFFRSQRRRRKILKVTAAVVMTLYTLLTLFPFYVLFVRSFVTTTESTELHLWIPPSQEVRMEQEVGNLAVFYDLDLADMKEALGIPQTEFLMARTTLREVAEEYDIPEEEIKRYFSGFYTFNGWITLLRGTAFWSAIGRTLLVTVVSLVGITVLSIFTGYGLAGLKRKDQMAIYNLYLLQMVIPGMLILLPQFLIVKWLMGLFPTSQQPGFTRSALQLVALILINIKGTALSTMIFTSAIGSIPKELEDAALIDGANEWQYIWYVLLPLLKVPIISLVVIMLPAFWNQFLEPYVYLDQSNSTLLPLMQTVVGQFSTNFQVIYAAILASILPLVLVYLVFRRFFIEGVMAGAVKG